MIYLTYTSSGHSTGLDRSRRYDRGKTRAFKFQFGIISATVNRDSRGYGVESLQVGRLRFVVVFFFRPGNCIEITGPVAGGLTQ